MFLAKSDKTLEQRISRYPSLKNRIELLINIIYDSVEDYQKANEAEMRVIEELRQKGSEALHCWSEHKIKQASEDSSRNTARLLRAVKKTLVAIYQLRRDSRL